MKAFLEHVFPITNWCPESGRVWPVLTADEPFWIAGALALHGAGARPDSVRALEVQARTGDTVLAEGLVVLEERMTDD